jgi:hypothetical protein
VQPDLEQQDQHAQLGERVQHRVRRIEDAEHGAAEQHAGEQLAEHRRLPHALHRRAEQLGRDEQRDEGAEQVREGVGGVGGGGGGHRAGCGERTGRRRRAPGGGHATRRGARESLGRASDVAQAARWRAGALARQRRHGCRDGIGSWSSGVAPPATCGICRSTSSPSRTAPASA